MNVTSLATCWKLKLKNGRCLGFTDFTADLSIDDLVYKAKSGFSSSAIERNISIDADNMEVSGFLDSQMIESKDVLSGIYDHAYIEIFMVDYQNPIKPLFMKSGYLGEVRLKNNQFTAEITSLADNFSNNIGKLYSPTCRAKFAGDECGVKDYSKLVCKILRKYSSTQILVSRNVPEIFKDGVVEFKESGGISIPIKKCDGKIVTVMFSTPENIGPRTGVVIHAGCDKKFSTCCDIYNNAVNFRGEPHIPGLDEIHKTAGTFK